MPHLHTNPGEHDFTASACIVRQFPDGPKLLVHMHRKIHRLMIPGGHVEHDENPVQTLAHELPEETGYQLSQLTFLQPAHLADRVFPENVWVHPIPFFFNTHQANHGGATNHHHSDMNFLLMVSEEPEGSPGETESQDLRWYSTHQLQTDPEVSSITAAVGPDAIQAAITGTWVPAKFRTS